MKAFPSQYTLKENDVFYYIHIPKTAGMTFRTVIADHFDSDEICPATLGHMMAQVKPQDLPKYRLLRGHLVYVDFKALLPQKQFVHATMLREPVAQLVSHYEYIRRMPTDPDYAKVKAMSLEEFVQGFAIANLHRNTQTYHIAKAARFDIENLPAQDVFEIALESLDHFAFAGLVERFQDSLFLLSYIFGWRPIMNTRKENASETKSRSLHKESYADRLSHATLQLIQESTQLDQQLYDYASQIFSDRFTKMIEDLQQHYPNPIPTPFTSPLPEVLVAQLEKHYEQRYRNLNIPTTETYRYDFAQALRGSGWQRREQPTEGLTYRWTGPSTQSTLDLPIAINQDLVLEFRVICIDSTAPDILSSLTVIVNNVVIPLKTLHLDPVTHLFQGTIPKSICEPISNLSFTRLIFQVNRVVAFRSLDPRDPDTRSVGIAINEVQIFPVTTGDRSEISANYSLALQLFSREFWQEPITFLQAHLYPKDKIIAPLSFQVKLPNRIQPNEAIADPNIQWVILQKDQTEHIISTLFKLFTKGFHPVFANGLFVIFTTHSQLPKVAYTSVDVKPLYVDILKRNFRKIVTKFTHGS